MRMAKHLFNVAAAPVIKLAAVTTKTAAVTAKAAAVTAKTAAVATKSAMAAAVALAMASPVMGQPTDSIFVYSPDARSGLHIAMRLADSESWQHVGQLCSSDYGTWGAEKRMFHPMLCRAQDGSWRLVFQVNDHSPVIAVAYSKNLIDWRPQDYPRMSTRQCLEPVVVDAADGFDIYYRSEQGLRHTKATPDFRHFTPDEPATLADPELWRRDAADVEGKRHKGQKFPIPSDELDVICQHYIDAEHASRLAGERMHDDDKTLRPSMESAVFATLNVDLSQEKAISDKLIGIFFEDISYAADGGLYAELVQNRDFEYNAKDHDGWNATTAWHSGRPIEIATEHPLHPNNPHYALLWPADTLWNDGWDGIVVEKGKKYDFSMFVLAGGQKQTFTIQLVGQDNTVLASAKLNTKGADWQQYATVLTATASDDKARLAVVPQKSAHVGIDMVSLFPQETFMNRKNGLRKDLAETIAALKPKFVRFPGGCMSHGQGLDNIYHWHHTIGPLEERRPDFNIWHYHQTRGLGFYEYFQFCEDIGAEPLPVLAAGVPCQNSAANADGVGGQQGGIPMAKMPDFIDELCHLIEWANGNPDTSEWARKRADAGHPEPFHLKYIGIGNEDIISTVFEERYEMICRAIRTKFPDIKICGTVGPFHAPSADYLEGWDLARRHPDLQYMVDEHYYESTGWFMHNRNYYDDYDRQGAKVYLGEWAASTRVKRPNLETALAEALYLTDIERNGDVVEMTSYAPMLCKDGHSNWNPDMIYFSNTRVRTTPAYEVQRLFSVYGGDRYVSTRLEVNQAYRHRVGASLVRDTKSGRRYLKLVNALPVPLYVSTIGLPELPAGKECLDFTGTSIDDQKATTQRVTTSNPLALPAYTMRVIEL